MLWQSLRRVAATNEMPLGRSYWEDGSPFSHLSHLSQARAWAWLEASRQISLGVLSIEVSPLDRDTGQDCIAMMGVSGVQLAHPPFLPTPQFTTF